VSIEKSDISDEQIQRHEFYMSEVRYNEIMSTLSTMASVNDSSSAAKKGFDWNHYLGSVGGMSQTLFASEFETLATGRVIKQTFVTEPWISACTRAISRQFQES